MDYHREHGLEVSRGHTLQACMYTYYVVQG